MRPVTESNSGLSFDDLPGLDRQFVRSVIDSSFSFYKMLPHYAN